MKKKDREKRLAIYTQLLQDILSDAAIRDENEAVTVLRWREDAAKWNELQEHPHFAGADVESIIDQSELDVKSRNEKTDQIETVKAHLNAVQIYDSGRWSISPISFQKLMRNLYRAVKVKP